MLRPYITTLHRLNYRDCNANVTPISTDRIQSSPRWGSYPSTAEAPGWTNLRTRAAIQPPIDVPPTRDANSSTAAPAPSPPPVAEAPSWPVAALRFAIVPETKPTSGSAHRLNDPRESRRARAAMKMLCSREE